MMYIYPNDRIPLFSIVLCTYNRAYILRNAIESVINQLDTDWELIIVDDGSSDDTSVLCREYAEKNSNIRYIYHSNRGLPISRNVGIYASSGIYITFLDSDDEYKNDHLSIRKHILFQNPNVDFLYGGLEIIGNQYVPDSADPSQLIHINDCYVGGTFFIKREILLSLGGFHNIDFAEDTDLAVRALEADYFIASVDYATYIYNRTLPDSICNKRMNN